MVKSTIQNFILLFVLIILAAIGSFQYFTAKKDEYQLAKADRGFTIANVRDVSKLVVKHVKLQPLIFTQNDGRWIINGKYDADPAVMVHIEKVLSSIRLLFVPPKNSTATILKSVKDNGIQIDVYLDGKNNPDRIIHIGSDTQDGDGTYMVLGGSDQPFAMHLPGLSGGLRSRFEQPLENYRDKFIFQVPLSDIKSLKVVYPKDNAHSFYYEHKAGFSIIPLMSRHPNQTTIKDYALKSYLSQFESLGAEKLINHYPGKDDILKLVPSCSIELKKTNGKVSTFQFYPYDNPEHDFGPAHSPNSIRNQNRLYVWVDSTDFYVVQNRVFGNIFRSYEDFVSLQ